MAELADALDSGSNSRKAVEVQVLLPAPSKKDTRQGVFFIWYIKKEDLNLREGPRDKTTVRWTVFSKEREAGTVVCNGRRSG